MDIFGVMDRFPSVYICDHDHRGGGFVLGIAVEIEGISLRKKTGALKLRIKRAYSKAYRYR